MNLYTVVYKKYANDDKTVHVVAPTVKSAIDGAKSVMRARYDADREILSVTKINFVDKVVS